METLKLMNTRKPSKKEAFDLLVNILDSQDLPENILNDLKNLAAFFRPSAAKTLKGLDYLTHHIAVKYSGHTPLTSHVHVKDNKAYVTNGHIAIEIDTDFEEGLYDGDLNKKHEDAKDAEKIKQIMRLGTELEKKETFDALEMSKEAVKLPTGQWVQTKYYKILIDVMEHPKIVGFSHSNNAIHVEDAKGTRAVIMAYEYK